MRLQTKKRLQLLTIILLLSALGTACFYFFSRRSPDPASLGAGKPKQVKAFKPAPAPTRNPTVPSPAEPPDALDEGVPDITHQKELFTRDGGLLPLLIRELALSESEQMEVMRSYKAMRAEISVIAKTKLHEDPIRTRKEEGATAYRLEPFAKEGEECWRKFKSDCLRLLGESRSVRLLSQFPKDQYFGDFGKRDVTILFESHRHEAGFETLSAAITEYDSRTGRQVIFHAGELDLVKKYIPDIFSVR